MSDVALMVISASKWFSRADASACWAISESSIGARVRKIIENYDQNANIMGVYSF
jgi:hypothetical protein